MERAGKIYYHALAFELSVNSNFISLRNAILDAAELYYPGNGYIQDAISRSFAAVGIGTCDITVSGILSSNETWEGFIPVIGDITIPTGITLTIDPGTSILFKSNHDHESSGYNTSKTEIIVEGILDAIGSENSKIKFTSIIDNPSNDDWGGIFVNSNGSIYLESSIIKNSQWAVYSDGGDNIVINKCQIKAIHYQGINLEDVTNAYIGANIIDNYYNNYYQDGIYIFGSSSVIIEGNIIKDNLRYGIQALGYGPLTIRDNLILNSGNSGAGGGGAYILASNSSLTIIENNTFVNNGELALWVCPPSNNSLITVRNNIIAFNNDVGLWNGCDYNSLPADYNNVYGNSGDDYFNTNEGSNDISLNPLFVDYDNGDFHLQSGSPCIDKGDPSSSLDPDGTRADMGAFYYDAIPSAPVLSISGSIGDNPTLSWVDGGEPDLDHFVLKKPISMIPA